MSAAWLFSLTFGCPCNSAASQAAPCCGRCGCVHPGGWQSVYRL